MTATQDAARRYIEEGSAVVPIPFKAKGPIIKGWQELRITLDELPKYFNGHEQNIGKILGEASKGLTDIDLDCLEARTLARYFLPMTACIFGRKSAPRSHWEYVVNPAIESQQWADKTKSGKLMLVELRGTGVQTVFPPSVHPSGEPIRFDEDGEPAVTEAAVLRRAVSRLAAASLLVRYWPDGSRHDCVLALAGGLIRGGWTEVETTEFIRAIVTATESETIEKHLAAVHDTAEKLATGETNITGWPTLSELLGELVVKAVQKWCECADTYQEPETATLISVRLADVVPEQVSYLWDGHIAFGKLNLFVGVPSGGKTWLSLDMAAHHSRGGHWPDGSICPKGVTLLMGSEDGLADTVRPRLDMLKADTMQIHAITGKRGKDGKPWSFNLMDDLDPLRRTVQETKATLIVIDPITAFLGKIDSYKDDQVRSVLGPLAQMAEEERVAILGIIHPNKSTTATSILNRMFGSIGFGAAARSVFGVAYDPGDETKTRRLFMPIKLNIAVLPPTLAFRIGPEGVEWEKEPVTGLTQEQVFGMPKPEETDTQHEARQFLLDLLVVGEPMPTKEIYAEGKKEGFSPKQLRRAAKAERVKFHKIGMKEGWQWWIPAS